MGLLDFLFGGGTTKTEQKYTMSPEERGLYNKLFPFLNFGTALEEGRTAYAPEIRGLENYARTVSQPYGGGAEIFAGLESKTRIQDLLNKYAVQRRGGVESTLANLVSGKGTQQATTQAPLNFAGLGELLGMLFAGGQFGKLFGGGGESFFGTGQTQAFKLKR